MKLTIKDTINIRIKMDKKDKVELSEGDEEDEEDENGGAPKKARK